jgi:Smg protein
MGTWRRTPAADTAAWWDNNFDGDFMTGSVLDILIYVFDQYMMAEAPEVPEREALAADLERAGFGRHNVERALDWLADLAGERSRPDMASRALRVFSGEELERISTSCRGYLLQLEHEGILSPLQREIVIDRLVALVDEVDIDQLKWLVLMVLSSQPGQEQACARMEHLLFEDPDTLPN